MTEQEQKNIFSENLNYYLNLLGISKDALAKAIGVSNATVTSWVQGTKLPRMGKVQSIADYFGVNVTDLINPKGEAGAFRDRLFAERRVLFDLLEKATPHQLDLVENFLAEVVPDESD